MTTPEIEQGRVYVNGSGRYLVDRFDAHQVDITALQPVAGSTLRRGYSHSGSHSYCMGRLAFDRWLALDNVTVEPLT